MLAAALGFIPLLGPIIQGVSGIFTGYFSTQTAVVQAGAQVAISETQASTQIIQATTDDIGIRILRDALLLGPVVWSGLISWDTIVALHYPDLMFHVAPYPPSLSFLPYAAMVFLLGNIGMNMWKRK